MVSGENEMTLADWLRGLAFLAIFGAPAVGFAILARRANRRDRVEARRVENDLTSEKGL
jgi:hypothetical protein